MNSIKYVFDIQELVMEIANHLDYNSLMNLYETLHKPIPHYFVKQLLNRTNGKCHLCDKQDERSQLYQLGNNIYCYNCISVCNGCRKSFVGIRLHHCYCGKVTCDECWGNEEGDGYDSACCRVINGGGMWHKPPISGIKISDSLEIINRCKDVKKMCVNDFKQLYEIFTRRCKSCSTKEFINTCFQCDQPSCVQCFRRCFKCKEIFCNNNTHLISCTNQLCKQLVCFDCIKECNKCHVKLCESHFLKCYHCEKTTCRKCFGYETNDARDTPDNDKCLTCTKQYHKWKKTRKNKN